MISIKITLSCTTVGKSVQASLFLIDSLYFVLTGFLEFLYSCLVLAVARVLFIELLIHSTDATLSTIDSSNRLFINHSRLCFELFDPSVFSFKFFFVLHSVELPYRVLFFFVFRFEVGQKRFRIDKYIILLATLSINADMRENFLGLS